MITLSVYIGLSLWLNAVDRFGRGGTLKEFGTTVPDAHLTMLVDVVLFVLWLFREKF